MAAGPALEATASLPGDSFLDACRQEGDPEADALMAEVFARAGADDPEPARGLFRAILEHDAVPAHRAGPQVRALLDAPLPRPRPDGETLRRGERVFAEHGPEILTALGCYALPAAYAANAGVQVLSQTGFLESHPTRRLVETAQMVVDVMRPGGLAPGGPGIRTARKVRLMHAAIRHLILARRDPAWDTAALGVPINQEDLAGTLMTFAWLPLQALERLGVGVAPADQDAVVRSWGLVGRLLGLREQLVPGDAAAADALTRRIQARQVHPGRPNPDGRALTRALLAMMEAHVPVRMLRPGPASLMRLFLPAAVADALGIPGRPLPDAAVRAGARLVGALDALCNATPLQRRLFRPLQLALVRAMIDQERGGKRPRFDLPLSLRGAWQL